MAQRQKINQGNPH